MHRFFLPPDPRLGDRLSLTGSEAHHALRVLRLGRGEPVLVLDGSGAEYVCRILDVRRDTVTLAVNEKRFVPRLPWQITLLQALPKGKIIESIIQKAVELGTSRIVPLLSERVAARFEESSAAAHKVEKWRTVAVEAIKQCGSAWLPRIDPPLTPSAFLARKEQFDLPFIASLQPGSRHAREFFDVYRREHQRPPQSVCVWVGPEGDFTPAEVAAVVAAGAQPITLGPLVLRSETAAVYCLSILNHELMSLTG